MMEDNADTFGKHSGRNRAAGSVKDVLADFGTTEIWPGEEQGGVG